MYIRGLLETKISLLLRIILPTVFMKGSIRSVDHFLAEMTDMKLAAYKQFSPIYKFYNIVTYASSVAKNLYQFSHFNIACAILKFSELNALLKSDSDKGTLHIFIAVKAMSHFSRLIHAVIMSFSYSAPGQVIAYYASVILPSSIRRSII